MIWSEPAKNPYECKHSFSNCRNPSQHSCHLALCVSADRLSSLTRSLHYTCYRWIVFHVCSTFLIVTPPLVLRSPAMSAITMVSKHLYINPTHGLKIISTPLVSMSHHHVNSISGVKVTSAYQPHPWCQVHISMLTSPLMSRLMHHAAS